MARTKLKDVSRNVHTVTVKRKQEKNDIIDKKLAESISRAADLSAKTKALREEFDGIKKLVIEKARKHVGDQQTVTFEFGALSCKVTFSKDAEIPKGNLGRLTKLLSKSNIDDLVRRKETFKPESRLIELAQENPEIAELIVIKDKAPSVNFTINK